MVNLRTIATTSELFREHERSSRSGIDTTVRQTIGAVRPDRDSATGRERYLFCQLERGTPVQIVGRGFNDQTVLCQSQQQLFYVFVCDLESSCLQARACAA